MDKEKLIQSLTSLKNQNRIAEAMFLLEDEYEAEVDLSQVFYQLSTQDIIATLVDKFTPEEVAKVNIADLMSHLDDRFSIDNWSDSVAAAIRAYLNN